MPIFHHHKIRCLLSRIAPLVFVLCFAINAAGQDIDLTYTQPPSIDLTSYGDASLALQPDGKTIAFGNFQVVNGVTRSRIARLNSDGTLDASFTADLSAVDFFSSVVVQPDGKILVAGGTSFGVTRLTRLDSNGSADGAFTSPFNQGGGSFSAYVRVHAVQSDGKILASVSAGGFHYSYTTLYRLNANGSIDNTFTTLGFDAWGLQEYLNDLIVLPGGKLLIGGRHAYGYIFKVNDNGSKDSSFESPLLTYTIPQIFPTVRSIALQSDGRVLFTGTFATVNGIARTSLSRLNADQSLDVQFPQTGYNGRVRVLSNDKILVGNTSNEGLSRLNPDGVQDGTFATVNIGNYNTWILDSSERILLFGELYVGPGVFRRYMRLGADGVLDVTFNPTAGTAGIISTIATQTDNKVIISGDFTRLSDVTSNNFARLNADSSLDLTFNAGSGFDNKPSTIVVLANGKILVGGGFSSYNGVGRANLVRLNSDGSLDTSFNPIVNGAVASIAVQTDNKILIGGTFTSVNGAGHTALARLNADGNVDATFNPLFASAAVSSIVVQSNDKISFGGSFSGVSGVARSNMARLDSTGGVDTSFNAGSISTVSSIIIQPDGKYLFTGGGTLKRLNVDGTADGTFAFPVLSSPGVIRSMLLQADGSIVIGGLFSTVNGIGRSNLARLTSEGSVDTAFFPVGANGEIKSMVAHPGSKVIIGGSFTSVQNVPRTAIARLNIGALRRIVKYDYDGDGKADVSVYRSSNNYWYISESSNSQFTFQYFGASGDIVAPGDYDGDGKTDLGIFRPSTGDWWYKSSITGVFTFAHFGANGDIPRPSDIDGDGRTDFVVYRESNNNWYRLSSATSQFSQKYFGAPGDKPVIGDFDGDGKSDPAIFRPSTGVFWYMSSIDSVHRAIPWGASTDIPAPADYDGDGKTDAAVYRPSTGYWYIYFSINGSYTFTQFGIAGDKPVPADYDGDGKADIAVYRPSVGTWYMLRSTAGFTAQQFGNSTDVPTPNVFVP